MPSKQQYGFFQKAFHWVGIPLLAVIATLWPTLFSGLSALQTDPGDTLLNHYFLEHAYQHVRDGQLFNPDHFWSPNYFWPIKDTLTWSDHLIGPAVIYGIVRQVLIDPYQAYAGWVIATLYLNYISLRKALRRISPNSSEAWLSLITLITAFSPAITMQLGHPQLLSLFLVGPVLALCHQLLRAKKIESFSLSNWLMLGFWLLCNGIFNIYIFVYACYGALMCALIHCARRLHARNFKILPGRGIQYSAGWLSASIAVNAVIYRPYLNALQTFGKRPLDEIINNLPKPASWLFSNDQWLLPPLFSGGRTPKGWVNGVEQQLFPGWLILILLAAALITSLRKPSRADQDLRMWLIAVGAMLIGSISIMDLSLWPVISKVLPGAGSLRASSRVGIIIILFCAPCLAFASNHWLQAKRQISKIIAQLTGFTAAFASILAISPPSFSISQWRKESQSISAALKANNCDVFWREWPEEKGEPWRAHVQAMHIQQRTKIPTLNGLSGQFPKHHWPYDKPSGDGAYAWIGLNNPGQFHRLRQENENDSLKRCIARWNPNTQTTEIRDIDVKSGIPLDLSETFKSSRSIFKGNGIEIIADNQNRLFVRLLRDKPPAKKAWTLLIRDGRPIAANRGNYMISDAELIDNFLFIDDTNLTEKIRYRWKINAETGVFIDQKMRKLNQ